MRHRDVVGRTKQPKVQKTMLMLSYKPQINLRRFLKCLERRRIYWSSLKYVKPTNGNWFPTKALGVGNVSTSPLSSSISSKLLVSMSLLSSGTTGAAADEENGGGKRYSSVVFFSVQSWTLTSVVLKEQSQSWRCCQMKHVIKWNITNRFVILTVPDGVEGPLVVFEERMPLDFLHTVSAQSHPPQKIKNK